MALVRTTLSSACASGDESIVVASATGFSAGYVIRIGGEEMRVGTSYSSGTTIPVIRATGGTVVSSVSFPATSGVVCGIASDFPNPAPQTAVSFPIAGRARTVASYSAAGAIALPVAGNDAIAILNGTSVLAMTVAAPTKANDGDMLTIVSNGAAAHTITFAGGLSGGGASYDVLTVNVTAPVAITLVAANSLWMAPLAPAMTGTVTVLTAGIA